ncbi:hypothetical protein DN752_23310 [Echinicola strongylocentroti]|uniref:Uncharacterized protein n=1 Tax=Echinicola strongylocentroti TaxID=1795355 RepID=A0A2Z4IP11_9BACT|nr:hypothetical protein DN752_23310 [Echinicola strongylocentroti]
MVGTCTASLSGAKQDLGGDLRKWKPWQLAAASCHTLFQPTSSLKGFAMTLFILKISRAQVKRALHPKPWAIHKVNIKNNLFILAAITFLAL